MGTHAGLQQVVERVHAAERLAKRSPGSVRLVAVSKTFPAEEICPVLDAGHRIFGENRVQEAAQKWSGLKQQYENVELHLIGPLQSNKAADAVALFDVIHTVDRDKIAGAIASQMQKQSRRPELFVQVNTGQEEQKAGVAPVQAREFVIRCREQHGLAISGLMCIPPVNDNPGPHFALLRKLGEEVGVQHLSMGMSADFEMAIEFGSTIIRVGSAIFGARG